MKIGIVSSYFYPWYGGITEHVYHQYRELVQRGHTVKLITPFDGSTILSDKQDLIKIGRPITFILNGSVVKIPLISKRHQTINRILDDHQFDIIHLHQPLFCLLSLTFLSCILKRRLGGYPSPSIVGTFHACGGGTERFVARSVSTFFKRYKHTFASKIAVSPASKNFIEPVFPGEYLVVPNGVDVKRFFGEKKKIERFDDGITNILFVGRLEPRKGLLTLIQSLPLINHYTDKKFRLIIVGSGIFIQFYKHRIPSQFLQSVVFTGEASFEDLPRYYKTAHIFCSPASYGESFGIVLIEAMAAGLPIIASNNEGYNKVIHDGVNGLLVDPDNPGSIAQAIGILLESQQLRKRLSDGALKEAQKYSWTKVVDQIEKIYFSIA